MQISWFAYGQFCQWNVEIVEMCWNAGIQRGNSGGNPLPGLISLIGWMLLLLLDGAEVVIDFYLFLFGRDLRTAAR